MNKRQQQITEDVIDIFKKRLDPVRIIMFGSRVKGKGSSRSDFDFAVDVKKPAFSKQRQINEEIEKASGLYKVDVVYLNSVDSGFREIILKTGKVLYEKRV